MFSNTAFARSKPPSTQTAPTIALKVLCLVFSEISVGREEAASGLDILITSSRSSLLTIRSKSEAENSRSRADSGTVGLPELYQCSNSRSEINAITRAGGLLCPRAALGACAEPATELGRSRSSMSHDLLLEL